jgi:signal transduction histidine kinase
MQLGSEFEELVEEVRAEGKDPRRVHLGETDYYVHVAHARVQECLRASQEQRGSKLEQLTSALQELRYASRVPLLVAHCRVVEGYAAWFRGDSSAAERLFEEAERLAVHENAPWVLYAVHRGRAHMLRAAGKLEPAHDQARLAEAIAREHGAVHRVRWIREEFGLPQTRRLEPGRSSLSLSLSGASSEHASSQSAVRARGYLRALRRITQASTMELDPKLQSRMVLDEIVQALRAERGLLLLSPFDAEDPAAPPAMSAKALELAAARDADGADLADGDDHDRVLVEDALMGGVVVTGDRAALPGAGGSNGDVGRGRRATIVAPLLVRGTTVGAVYLERAAGRGAFLESDAEVLAALSAQVPVALELARLLYMRERAAESLRTAQKMQAVARFAGGVAHDFNNLMQTIGGMTTVLLESVEEARQRDDLLAISDIVQHARGLTKQLMSFSRGAAHARPEVIELRQALGRMRQVLAKLVGERVTLELVLAEDLGRVRIDRTQLDQVMTNLVANARDAIEGSGTVRIAARNVRLDEASVRERPALDPGEYVLISVTDSGIGMDDEVRARLFEPYFTTKAEERGTGLGLAIVYSAVTQTGGQIEVTSRPGEGTTFELLLPRTTEPVAEEPALKEPRELATVVVGKVLVVDDEMPALQSTCRMLELCGYQTLAAPGGDDALRILAERGDEIAVLVTDVQMPKMDGIALAQQIAQMKPDLPIVFVSGGSDERLRGFGLKADVDCLTKPLFREVLDRKIREVVAAQLRNLPGSRTA